MNSNIGSSSANTAASTDSTEVVSSGINWARVGSVIKSALVAVPLVWAAHSMGIVGGIQNVMDADVSTKYDISKNIGALKEALLAPRHDSLIHRVENQIAGVVGELQSFSPPNVSPKNLNIEVQFSGKRYLNAEMSSMSAKIPLWGGHKENHKIGMHVAGDGSLPMEAKFKYFPSVSKKTISEYVVAHEYAHGMFFNLEGELTTPKLMGIVKDLGGSEGYLAAHGADIAKLIKSPVFMRMLNENFSDAFAMGFMANKLSPAEFNNFSKGLRDARSSYFLEGTHHVATGGSVNSLDPHLMYLSVVDMQSTLTKEGVPKSSEKLIDEALKSAVKGLLATTYNWGRELYKVGANSGVDADSGAFVMWAKIGERQRSTIESTLEESEIDQTEEITKRSSPYTPVGVKRPFAEPAMHQEVGDVLAGGIGERLKERRDASHPSGPKGSVQIAIGAGKKLGQ